MNTTTLKQDLVAMLPELKKFALKLTANIDDADDLSQDTILRALENMDKYIDGTNFKAWVYTIMCNIFINNYRRTTREQTFIDYTDNLYSININQVDPNYITENDYDKKEINKTVNKLPQKYKVPFIMHVSGFKYREISDKLSLPLGTIKSRIFTTKHYLQVELSNFR